MNIAKIMIPRACTVFLNEKQTVRQGWEVMTRNGYTAIPVLDAEQHYIGTVSEGDFLRYVLDTGSLDKMIGRGIINGIKDQRHYVQPIM